MYSRCLRVVLIVGALMSGTLTIVGPTAEGNPGATIVPAPGLKGGKQLYRQYCGQCHALSAALAAGFGSDNGLGQNGGPSFNTLRVPFNMSIVAVTTPFAGHELVFSKLTWTELNQVAKYIALVTKTNSTLAS
jgi:mono/diheme cytochrome c family protein